MSESNQPPSGLPLYRYVKPGETILETDEMSKGCSFYVKTIHAGKLMNERLPTHRRIEAVKDGTECDHNWIKGTGDYYCGKCLAHKDESEPAKRWVYHYAARKFGHYSSVWSHCSGILELDSPILSNEEYHKAIHMALTHQEAKSITITSLSLLHGPA